MPADMDPDAQAVWERVLRDMRRTGVLRSTDADVLRCYCEAVSRYAAAARLYAQTGPLTRRAGYLVENPLLKVMRDNADEIRAFARELGLSPSSRVALRIDQAEVLESLNADLDLPPRLRVAGDAT
jgi:P27 family predicted phage terminase small subunit